MKLIRLACTILLLLTVSFLHAEKKLPPKTLVRIILPSQPHRRLSFGADRLATILTRHGYTPQIVKTDRTPAGNTQQIWIRVSNAAKDSTQKKEGFSIRSTDAGVQINGNDPSGALYGCLELAERISKTGKLPSSIDYADAPEMVLRGACIGVQKPYYLPGRTVYEYPYTPETFPWFYDKQLWIQYLDSLVDNRMNSLYLWNGHPFASLVRVKEYPYAVEVDSATFKKNEEIYRFITTEADKRGIWVIQMFYNIIVSKPFAEHHQIKTQDRERPITPLIADYTRKSIAAFVEKYPNVGLMVCLGEAMEGVGNDDIEWFTKTIIPGVQDGLKAMGRQQEPPIVLRAHDTDAPAVMKAALPLYKNLYTEAKFNGEALTTPEPRGKWAELHQTLSRIGTVQIENVHILANLEPFRYGATDFIQRSVKGMHRIMEGNGLHLYPQASYWDWPYSADSVKGKKLLQVERDWLWYKAWSRYAWRADRDRKDEVSYWSALLAGQFGCSTEQAMNILAAYEESGEIAPKLLRRFGITDGNRQTLTLGMLMTQLINPYRYGLFTLLYESESPEGEMLIDYADKEWKKEKHIGETPVQIIREVKAHGDKAVAAINKAIAGISHNKPEFDRIKNDVYCYQALAYHYAQKAEAALHILRFKYSNDISDLEKALPFLEQSIASYRKLVDLTKATYRYANSMQTQQRKIPIRGSNGTFKTWAEVLVPFEAELVHFKKAIDSIKHSPAVKKDIQPLQKAIVTLQPGAARFTINEGVNTSADSIATISGFAPELKGLEGLVMNSREQLLNGTELKFTTTEPVKILVGYYNGRQAAFSGPSPYLKAPELETNAAANDYGQADIRVANAIVIKGWPPVNIHTYSFPAGTHTLKLAKGYCLVLGFVKAAEVMPPYDAGLTESGMKKEIDWLFE